MKTREEKEVLEHFAGVVSEKLMHEMPTQDETLISIDLHDLYL